MLEIFDVMGFSTTQKVFYLLAFLFGCVIAFLKERARIHEEREHTGPDGELTDAYIIARSKRHSDRFKLMIDVENQMNADNPKLAETEEQSKARRRGMVYGMAYMNGRK